MAIQKMNMRLFGNKLWAVGLGLFLFMVLPNIAFACLDIPDNPPDVSIVGDACDGEILIILEDFSSYGAEQGDDFCACAFNLPSLYGEVVSAEIVHAGTMIPLPGFSFGPDPDTSGGFGDIAPVNPPEYWTGFSSAVSETISAGLPVDIVFRVSTANTDLQCDVIPDQIASFLESADEVVGSSGANEEGYPDHHTSIQPVKNISIEKEPVSACVKPPSNMVAWWTLDETAGPMSADIALYANDGTHVNNPAPTSGMVDGALSFDGSNYVQVPSHNEINFGKGDFSIDAWVKTTDASGVKILVDKRYENIAGDVQGYSLYLGNGQLGFQLADGDGSWFCSSDSDASSCTNYGSGVSVADGEWHLVAVTVDRDDPAGGRFYVDGSLVSTFNPTVRSGSLDNDKPLRIASRSSFETGLFRGEIDEVELFDRVLTDAEIESIYEAGSAGKCKDQVETGEIHGTKWLDENGNGIQDDGEPGLEGWTILLENEAGTVISTVTDGDGNYWFMDLNASTYTVTEVIQPGWTQTYPTSGAHTGPLGPGDVVEGLNFGNWQNSDERCTVGWDINVFNSDVNTVEVGMNIFNDSGSNASYQLNVVGYPGFTINGFFTVPSQPIFVPNMGVVYVQVHMSPLPTFSGPSGQYQIIVTNEDTGHSFGCSAQLWQSDLLGVHPEGNVLARAIRPGVAQELVFELKNLAEEEIVAQIRIEEMFGVQGKEIKAIRLNGQEIGEPLFDKIAIPAGEVVKVAVEIELVEDIPNGAGDIILFADIDDDGEPDVASSVLIRQAEERETADIYVTPADETIFASDLHIVTIQIDNIQDFYGNQLEINYDPTIVEVVDAYDFLPGVQIQHGDFLTPDAVIKNIADNGSGVIQYSTSLQGDKTGINGSGILAQIAFRGLVSGTSPISLNNVILSDPQSVAIDATKQGGQIVVKKLSYDVSGQVLLERRGDNNNSGTEVCVGIQCVITGDDGAYIFNDVAANGQVEVRRQSYLSSTHAYSATTGGLLIVPDVTLLGGDINQDGAINVMDGASVGGALNSTPGDAHWDVRADVTDDGKVDILDMVAVQFNWNEAAPGPWAVVWAASRRNTRSVIRSASVEGVYAADAEAQVAITPAFSAIQKLNGSTKVDIMADDVTDLYAYTVVTSFDPDKVQVVDANPTEEGIQIQIGDLLDPFNQFVLFNQVDNENGTLELSVTQTHPAEAKSGSGVLGTVTFEALGVADTAIELTSATILVDNSKPDPQGIAATMQNSMLRLGTRMFLPMLVR